MYRKAAAIAIGAWHAGAAGLIRAAPADGIIRILLRQKKSLGAPELAWDFWPSARVAARHRNG
jgi:hypothetical protein